jgi:hypothetical protein
MPVSCNVIIIIVIIIIITLTEINTRNFPGGKGRPAGRPARKDDNLTTVCEPTV